MPVNGLMLTLTEDSRSASTVRARLAECPQIEVGLIEDRWMSVVVDAANQGEAKELHRWLESLDEVNQVEVICVTLNEDSNSENDE